MAAGSPRSTILRRLRDTILTDANHDTIKLAGVTVAQLQAHPNDFHLT